MRKKELEKRIKKLENAILEAEKVFETIMFAGNIDLSKTEVFKDMVLCIGHPIYPPCDEAWKIRYVDKNKHVATTHFALCGDYPNKPEILESDRNSAIIRIPHDDNYEWYILTKSTGVITKIPKPAFAEWNESVVVEE